MNGTFDVARDKVDSETGEALIQEKFGEKLPGVSGVDCRRRKFLFQFGVVCAILQVGQELA